MASRDTVYAICDGNYDFAKAHLPNAVVGRRRAKWWQCSRRSCVTKDIAKAYLMPTKEEAKRFLRECAEAGHKGFSVVTIKLAPVAYDEHVS